MAKNTNYTSDVMNFIQDFLESNLEVAKNREILRNTWWDNSSQGVEESRELNKNNLIEDGYKYFNYKDK
jgi:hypothetical protein